MPRNASGTYTLPLPPVVPDTVIEAVWANTTDDDIAQSITDSLDRYGRGGMVAPFRLVDGTVGAPALSFTAETGTGLFRESAGVMGVAVQGAKIGQWAVGGMTLAPGKTLTAPSAALTSTQAITLSGGDNAIVWYDSVAVQNKGAIQSVGDYTAGFLSINANSAEGLYLQNRSASMKFKGALFSPLTDLSVDLGSALFRWGNVYASTFRGSYGVMGESLAIAKNTALNYEGPMLTIDNRGTTGAPDSQSRLGGIAWSAYRDVMNPSYIAGIYGVNTGYPGTIAAIDFVVSNDNGGSMNPTLASVAYKMRLNGNQLLANVSVNADVTGINPAANAFQALCPVNNTGVGLVLAGFAGSAGQYIRALRFAPTLGEPTTYRMDMEVNCTSTSSGFPEFRYDWIGNQYNGFGPAPTCSIYAMTGQWNFSVAIGNPSSASLKSNWTYETGDVVDGLAAITEVGSFDFNIGTYAEDDPIVSRRGAPIPLRQVGVSAEQLQAVMPDAVSDPSGDGILNVTYGNAALVAAVALAKRLKAIEAFVGM